MKLRLRVTNVSAADGSETVQFAPVLKQVSRKLKPNEVAPVDADGMDLVHSHRFEVRVHFANGHALAVGADMPELAEFAEVLEKIRAKVVAVATEHAAATGVELPIANRIDLRVGFENGHPNAGKFELGREYDFTEVDHG
jgi:hypothetical protein